MSASLASVVQRCQHSSAICEKKPTSSLPILVDAVAVKGSCKMYPGNSGVKPGDGNKKYPRLRSEQAIHLIPCILLFCALILWLGSTPAADTMGAERSGGQGWRDEKRSGGNRTMPDIKGRKVADSGVSRASLRGVMPKRLRGAYVLVDGNHHRFYNVQ